MKVASWIGLLSGPAALVVAWIAKANPHEIEIVFSRHFYSLFMPAWSRLWQLLPFTAAPWLLIALALATVASFVWWPWTRALLATTIGVSMLVAWFTLTWGLNYQRQSWAQNHGRIALGGTIAQLTDLAEQLESRSAKLAPLAASHPLTQQEIFAKVRLAYLRRGSSDPLLSGDYPAPKSFPWPAIFSWVGIGGIFIPFTAEPLVNPGPPRWSLPFTATHEAAHLHGWAREDEANFLGFWVLHDDPHPAMAYSAWSTALLYVASSLQSSGPEGQAAWATVSRRLDPRIRADWNALFAYWKQFEGPVSKAAGAVNDLYLKGQGQNQGIKSYGRMVDLLLAWKDSY